MNIFKYILPLNWLRKNDQNRPIVGSRVLVVGLRVIFGHPAHSGARE
jgi:hypothetical protein